MTPTPYAIAVREQVHDLLQQVRGVLAPSRELDLATLERTFTLRWHDALVALSGPALLAAVREQAPGCGCGSSRNRASTHRSCGAERWTSRRTPAARPRRRSTPTGWPRPGRSSSYGGGIRSPGSRPSPPRATPRRITSACRGAAGSRTSSTTPLRASISRGGWWSPRPRRAPRSSSRGVPTSSSPRPRPRPARPPRTSAWSSSPPLDLPPAPVYLSWHQRYDTDPAHIWLRTLARTALTDAVSALDPSA